MLALGARAAYAALAVAVVLAAGVVPAAPALAGEAAATKPEAAASSAGYYAFFGDLHAHTAYSDGEKTPAEAYRYAREKGRLDFLGLSDHAYVINARRDWWADTLEQARRHTEEGAFIALAGGEWTEGTEGHINVFSWVSVPDRERVPNYRLLYQWFAERRAQVIVAGFNHPNPEFQRNWEAFRYDPAADGVVQLLEVASGPRPANLRYEQSYVAALDRGWHVGAIAVSDTHRASWGTATPSRTGLLLAGLTVQELQEALRERRTYATEDSNLRLGVFGGPVPAGDLSGWTPLRGEEAEGRGRSLIPPAGSVTMGSVLPLAGPVALYAVVEDPDAAGSPSSPGGEPGDRIVSLEWIGKGGRVLARLEPDGPAASVSWARLFVPEEGFNWYYLRVVQADGDRAVSSPIWVEHQSQLRVTDLRFEAPLPQVGREGRIRALVINAGPDRVEVPLRFWVHSPRRHPIGEQKLVLGPGEVAAIEQAWTPEGAGVTRLELVLGDPANRYATEVRVWGEKVPRVLLDEGHNNRYTGLGGEMIEQLRASGYDAGLLTGALTEEALQGVGALWVAAPEQGFSLTPTRFSPEELEAVARFVREGGRLVVFGNSGGRRQRQASAEANRLLEAVGSRLRFAIDAEVRTSLPADGSDRAALAVELIPGEGGSGPVSPELAWRRLVLREAAPVQILPENALKAPDASEPSEAGESSGMPAVFAVAREPAYVSLPGSDEPAGWQGLDANSEAQDAAAVLPVGAWERVGKGVVVVLGAPGFSVYESRLAGFVNGAFHQALAGWLVRMPVEPALPATSRPVTGHSERGGP